MLDLCSRSAKPISSTLPLPTNVDASGRSRRPRITSTTCEPALSTRRAASSARSFVAEARPMSRLTRTARERSGVLRMLKRDRYRPRRDHRGNGVLVDHLGNGVLEEHHVLVERLDLPLQLDAVHEVDGDRDVFLAQRVEEGILQQLTFVAHCCAPFLRVSRSTPGRRWTMVATKQQLFPSNGTGQPRGRRVPHP